MNINEICDFYNGKRILVTGHTGFKGSWMTKLLLECGANITGYSLEAPTKPSLFEMLGLCEDIKEGAYKNADGITGGSLNNVIADIRDLDSLKKAFDEAQPEVVIHMAAQPIVRESYKDPVGTYATNVMGTVNVMECVRLTPSVKSFVNVTTDKVYKNRERNEGYREDEELNGYDPYSNSKSCSELVTDSYRKSFFVDEETGESILSDKRIVAISTMRAGNVIGGGDFAKDRIIPDCIRAAMAGEDIIVRNPYSIRPYQHVLEPVTMYLYVAMMQYKDCKLASSYNIGPRDTDAWTTGEITTLFCDKWNNTVREYNDVQNPEKDGTGKKGSQVDLCSDIKWINKHDGGPHEATYLKLDCSKVRDIFGWEPKWSVADAMEKIVEWSVTYAINGNVAEKTTKQIREYLD